MPSERCIAFWNVENLFDQVDAPPERRPAKIAGNRELMKYLKGWDAAVLDRKLGQLSAIAAQLGDHGPDVLGVAEVENAHVVGLLAARLGAATGRSYQVVHHDTPDRRGIDVAFLYDAAVFEADPAAIFSREIQSHLATRELLQVTLRDRRGHELVLIGNHWPSRLGGEQESEAYRIVAAETLSYWHRRVRELKGVDVSLIALGDFNDEPFNRSLMQHAGAERSRTRLLNRRNGVDDTPYLLNLMWPALGTGQASHVYEGDPNVLDQILVARGLLNGKGPFQLVPDSARIEALPAMIRRGEYRAPRPFGAPSQGRDGYDLDGYADHFPVSVRVR